ncbi:Protein Tax-1 [Homalodisca vitripennis]|nr:Protein Tax-1 [Homalodisca vitripennis]
MEISQTLFIQTLLRQNQPPSPSEEVDLEGLKKQIEEKKIQEDEEKKLEEAYVNKQIRDSEIAKRLERQIEENKRRLNEEINEFRSQYQKAQDRREFDLYDPDGLKKSLPCRLLDDDPRLSISSAQKFEGEDITTEARRKIQREQQKAWLEQQMLERCRADEERKQAEQVYHDALVARDKRAVQLDEMERECKRKLEQATCRFNQALVAEQETRKRMQEMRDMEDQQAEIYNAITSDFLTENPNLRASNLGPNRINGAFYKGMTDAEREEIRQYNLSKIEENKIRQQEEAKREADWLALSSEIARSVSLKDREIMKKQKEIEREVREQNRILDCERKRQQEYLDKVVYTNTPTAAYFEQFNTTTR